MYKPKIRVKCPSVRTFLSIFRHEKAILISKKFPKEEIFAFTSQIRRAAVSISNNIAEGTGSRYIHKRINYIDNAIGSSNEVENLIEYAFELNYIEKIDQENLNKKVEEVRKMLYGLVKSLEEQVELDNR